jgi:hypothetical protein
MKRFTLLAVLAFALLAPTIAYGEGAKFVYRPELKQWVVVPQATAAAQAAAAQTPPAGMAKHEGMASTCCGGQKAAAHDATHCERMMAAHETAHK